MLSNSTPFAGISMDAPGTFVQSTGATAPDAATAACGVCANTAGNRVHVAHEMMFGTREEFRYLECGECRCLALLDVPPDLSRYYPPGYYAYARDSGAKAALRIARARHAAGQFSALGGLATAIFGRDYTMRAIGGAGIAAKDRVLDVGCGSGQLLRTMHALGYRNLGGVDAFIEADIVLEGGIRIRKATLAGIAEAFDVVMFNHSFEHMPDPGRVLQSLNRLLAPGGRVLIRIPVAGSEAWRRYGVHWMHLDAPRHLFIHSTQSLRLLAQRAGLEVTGLVYEGNASQFVGSEQIARGIALMDRRSVYSGGWRRWANWPRTWMLERRAEQLNREGKGDWARFELKNLSP
jgi:SAM-dependent methyltransferase